MKTRDRRDLPPPRKTPERSAAEARRRLVDLWLQRPKRERTTDGVEKLYAWLLEHEPALVPNGAGALRQLMEMLKEHVEPG